MNGMMGESAQMRQPILLIALFLLLFCPFACTPQNVEEENIYFAAKIINAEYDQVWETLECIMVDELMYPIKKKDKARGIIQTDWISVIRIRGTLRWYMRVLIEREGRKTLVKIYDRVEEPEQIRGKFKDKKGNVKTGWKVSKEEIADADKILQKLSTRLE